MASWYSKLLTTTTSQISSLQSRILSGEHDGDTEDDTHVCRVLRAYYTEQTKPFPGWLPPDPKAPPPAAPVYAQPQVGSRYGGLAQQQPGAPGGGTGLSSLWDSSGGAKQPGAPAQGSLRQNQFARGSGGSRSQMEPAAAAQARPLPSQRGGSYQAQNPGGGGRNSGGTPPPGGSSAQDKLKQRLWGGGSRTTSPSSGTSGPFQPPRQPAGGIPPGGRGGGQGGDYEGRFAPGGMYDPTQGSGRPSMSSSAGEYGGGRSGRPGLPPGGPRGGLPSGPRMR